MNPAAKESSHSSLDAHKATETFVESWIKARVDEPANVMSGYNEAAKQLIGVSGLLQGVYLAVFTFGDLKGAAPLPILILLFLPLLSVVYCSATVLCTVPKDFNVHKIFEVLRRSSADPLIDSISISLKEWCERTDRIATKKRNWLHAANWSFIGASVVTVLLLIATAMKRMVHP